MLDSGNLHVRRPTGGGGRTAGGRGADPGYFHLVFSLHRRFHELELHDGWFARVNPVFLILSILLVLAWKTAGSIELTAFRFFCGWRPLGSLG